MLYKKEIIEDNRALRQENRILKERINKAIEYIKDNNEKQFGLNYEYGLTDKEITKLLEILKGEDK